MGTIAPTPPSSGSSTGSTEESRASSSRDGSSTSVSAFGSESPGSQLHSTSSVLASDSVNMTATLTITSTSVIEHQLDFELGTSGYAYHYTGRSPTTPCVVLLSDSVTTSLRDPSQGASQLSDVKATK